jgi:hypothetical protein
MAHERNPQRTEASSDMLIVLLARAAYDMLLLMVAPINVPIDA